MALLPFDPLAVIASHSDALYAAASGRMDAPVPSCPGWSVADLVAHLTKVHWFWATVVEELPTEPPAEEPSFVGDPLEAGREQAARLVRVLEAADPRASCWTWAPWRQDVAFVLRHQVQEAVVHHFDADPGSWAVDPVVAADCVDEFLTFSVYNEHWIPHFHEWEGFELPAPLDGSLSLLAADTGQGWTVRDGSVPGTVVVAAGAADGPVVAAPAGQLLLWLYGRVELDLPGVPEDLVERFRKVCSTD